MLKNGSICIAIFKIFRGSMPLDPTREVPPWAVAFSSPKKNLTGSTAVYSLNAYCLFYANAPALSKWFNIHNFVCSISVVHGCLICSLMITKRLLLHYILSLYLKTHQTLIHRKVELKSLFKIARMLISSCITFLKPNLIIYHFTTYFTVSTIMFQLKLKFIKAVMLVQRMCK